MPQGAAPARRHLRSDTTERGRGHSGLPRSLFPVTVVAAALWAPAARADEPRAPVGPPPAITASPIETPPPPAPPGYHYEQKRALPLLIVGASTLGLGWVASSATGALGLFINASTFDATETTDFGPMFVPLAGPFITLGMQPRSQRSDGFTAAAMVMGGSQIVGASLLIGGLALGKKRELVLDRSPYEATISVRPVVGSAMTGLVFAGRL